MSVELEHRFEGDPAAPPVLLASSLGAEMGIWDEQVSALSEGLRLLRFNARGHGSSPAPPGPYSIEELAGDVIALLDQHQIERAGFAGISLGGMIGLRLAIDAPSRIERLAICSSTPWGGPAEPWRERAATVRAQGMAALAEATLERWFGPEFHRDRPERVDEIRAMLLRTDPEAYAGCCEAIAGHDVRRRLGEIEAPTLVITAAGDPTMSPEIERTLADGIAGARLLALPEGQHLVNVERPGDVNGPLLEHLAAGSG